MNTPIIEIQNLKRVFISGGEEIAILKNLNLSIQAGEMVAIIGQSGSGKSTLMNILGCLDRPSSGSYRLNGIEINDLNLSARAKLRREYIGFIFQRYHLLGDLRAWENVAIPAVYAGIGTEARQNRAEALLKRLGLSERLNHRPNQLSGGQQQRVSIARALMNGGQIIFADEPTGALDSRSGEEVMKILSELHAEGHTIILVTHDREIANRAERIIELKDGEIISDEIRNNQHLKDDEIISDNRRRNLIKDEGLELKDGAIISDEIRSNQHLKDGAIVSAPKSASEINNQTNFKNNLPNKRFNPFGQILNAFVMALRAIWGHKLRAFLTMLGIIIGIASVVTVVALGQGSQAKILKQISSLGSNTIEIFSGQVGDRRSFLIKTLIPADADVLAQQEFIDSATPTVRSSAVVRSGNQSLNANVTGVGEQYFQVKNLSLRSGRSFNQDEVQAYSAVAVIDQVGVRTLFNNRDEEALNQVILLYSVPVRIIGVVDTSNQPGSNENTIGIFMPYTSAMNRIMGRSHVSSILLRVRDGFDTATAEDAITRILTRRHGSKDFSLFNSDSLRKTIEQTTQTMTLLISAIAGIALIVGGIGVMNIMLVSVTERTQEIGIRMAVGARQSDILWQFLIEALVLCLLGGAIGIGLSYLLGWALSGTEYALIYSTTSVIVAFACSSFIGLLFGYLPARNASRLDPVEALARE